MTGGACAGDFVSPLPPQFSDGSQRAFPTAEGYGARALGGRGGKVLHVTNLDDSGTGSLRWALGRSGPRTVVFDVGGLIELDKVLLVDDPYLTIAGHTAPGDGICIKGAPLLIRTHDVIVRHMCSRPGNEAFGSGYDNRDAFQIERAQNVILDHVSASWSVDELATGWFDDTSDLTIQWSIMSEALMYAGHSKGYHSMGPLMGPGVERVSILNNLMAHNWRRNPRLSRSSPVDVVNNVIYNWGGQGIDLMEGANSKWDYISPDVDTNVVGNVLIPGPNSRMDHRFRVNVGDNSRVYISGNVDETGADADTPTQFGSVPSVLVSSPGVPLHEVQVRPTDGLVDLVLANAGARLPVLDPVDGAVVDSVRTRSGGLIDQPDESVAGGYPDYRSGTPPEDFDGDGMPDSWELAHGLDPDDPADGDADMVGDGWTNLEYYLNQLAGDYQPVADPAPAPEPDPAPEPEPGPASVHISDLDLLSVIVKNRRKWRAVVQVQARDGAEQWVAGATVTGRWSGAARGTSSCVTGDDGLCRVAKSSRRKRRSDTMTFTVQSVDYPELDYVADDNHDPDGDSDGTTIVIERSAATGSGS